MKLPHTVLITGASQGLGAVIARSFHAQGWQVGISDIDAQGAAKLANEIDPSGQRALAISLDVRDPVAFGAAYNTLASRWGSVEALINNAVLTRVCPVLDISLEEFGAVSDVNLRGTFVGCQIFGRYFKESRYGRIVNIASLAGQNGGTATGAHYAASKGGIITLTKVFARELAPFGVTVNAVAPGPLDLPSVHSIVPRDRLDEIMSSIPVGHLGAPEFVASAVMLLASPQAAFASGATWDINGGLYMR
jgi:3-oxoacyl-[acyl-carrier protein] reductase